LIFLLKKITYHISLNSTELVRLILCIYHHIDHGWYFNRKYIIRWVEKDTLFQLVLECNISSAIPKILVLHFSWDSLNLSIHLWIQDSIISQAMCFSLWLRCCANSGSGQWRSPINDWRASSFQKRSSDVAHPFLLNKYLFENRISLKLY